MNKMFRDKHQIIKLIFLSAVFLLPQLVFSATSSPDAIAVRVIPNPNHLSPLRWYQSNNFKGSPQAMQVDGYEAVRDGRTVYVNAANISGNDFYTNIYLLSFNQNVEKATQDIFDQLLAQWKFNTNIPQANKDNVRKDTKRLADLAEIKLALGNYQKKHNGDFPSLSAGSYVAGKSLSVWPSWQATLGKELGITMPVDPDNKLGICSTISESENKKYDPVTCWDQRNKKFADPTPENSEFNLPDNSRVYIYTYNGKKSYNICALMQSGYLTTLAQGACPDSAVGHEVTCTDTVWTPRYNPTTICSNLNITITETSDCGRTRNTLHGSKIDSACCTPTSPNCAADTCAGQTCNTGCAFVNGTKTDTVWTPNTARNLICSNQLVTETGDCGATRNITYGTKTDGACCTPTSPNCAADTCAGQTCNTGCAFVNGTKTDTVWTPNTARNLICSNQLVTETGDCGATRNITYGTKTDGACARFTLSGNVKAALTGLDIAGALVSMQTQAGVEVKNATTDGSGNFIIPLLISNADYKIIITKSGYKPGGILHYVFVSDKIVQLYLFPDTFVGLAAIVLRWEKTVTDDLDAHLKFSAAGTDYHVFHQVKNAGGSSLDLDSRTSPGQETVTIRSAEIGVEYSYFVKAYGLEVTPGESFNPTVKVQLFNELGMLIREFTGQSSNEGHWHIFKFTPSIGVSSLVVEDFYESHTGDPVGNK